VLSGHIYVVLVVVLRDAVESQCLCEGFVLKKDQKKESEEEQISLEDLIEREVILLFFTFPYLSPPLLLSFPLKIDLLYFQAGCRKR